MNPQVPSFAQISVQLHAGVGPVGVGPVVVLPFTPLEAWFAAAAPPCPVAPPAPVRPPALADEPPAPPWPPWPPGLSPGTPSKTTFPPQPATSKREEASPSERSEESSIEGQ
jgi:hypothetical protein